MLVLVWLLAQVFDLAAVSLDWSDNAAKAHYRKEDLGVLNVSVELMDPNAAHLPKGWRLVEIPLCVRHSRLPKEEESRK